MQETAMFWDRIARRYAARPVGDPSAYAATLERVRSYLRPTDRALELGCGTGTTALFLGSSVAALTGTDISAEMIAIAREKAEAEGAANLRFAQAAVAEAGRGETFDVVMAFNLLHLIDDLPGTLGRVRDLLPVGGHFISKTPCLAHRRWLYQPLVAAMRLLGRAPRVMFLAPEAVENAVRAAGFEIVETGDYPNSTQSRFIVARKV